MVPSTALKCCHYFPLLDIIASLYPKGHNFYICILRNRIGMLLKKKKNFFLQTRIGAHGRAFGFKRAQQGPVPPFLFHSQSWGEQGKDKKGNKVLDRKANQLSRGNFFRGNSFTYPRILLKTDFFLNVTS